jgi:hypothetical protein
MSSAALSAQRSATLALCVLLGLAAGAAVALAQWNAAYLAVALFVCAFILLDFRVGVLLLIVLMPLSRSHVFPHAMFGITGLNPVNLLLLATLGACLLQSLASGTLRRFLPAPLAWLYVLPLAAGAALGVRHVDDIAPFYYPAGLIEFSDAAGYLRDMLAKPLLLAVFALLVAAAVARSARPAAFLVPTALSVWVMSSLVLAFVLAAGVSLGQLAQGGARDFLSPLGLHANEFGRLYVTAYALLLFTAAQAPPVGARLLLLASAALAAAALLLTFSRGAFVGFAVVNLVFLAWWRGGYALLAVLALAALAPFAAPEALLQRLGTGFGESLNAISAGRIEGLWRPLVPDLLRSPLVGSGLGSILWSEAMQRALVDSRIIASTHPHNAYFEALLDVGAIGLALLVAYFAHLWRSFRALAADAALEPMMRGFYQGAAAALAAFLVAAFTDGSLAPRAEQVYLWLAIGMMYGQRAARAGR